MVFVIHLRKSANFEPPDVPDAGLDLDQDAVGGNPVEALQVGESDGGVPSPSSPKPALEPVAVTSSPPSTAGDDEVPSGGGLGRAR